MEGVSLQIGSSTNSHTDVRNSLNAAAAPGCDCDVGLSFMAREKGIDSAALEEVRDGIEAVGQGIELTVVQLLPDFDGTLDDMALEEPVSYTDEQLTNLRTEVIINENVAAAVMQEAGLDLIDGFIPPSVLQKMADSADDVDSLNPDTARKVFQPCLQSRQSTSLSVTRDGFIQMNDYKISFDSMGGGRLSEVRVAFNETNQQHYAVKILSKRKMETYNLLLRSSRNPLEEAHREIGILKRLDHPNIIKLVEVVDNPTDDNIYIVFELLDQALMDLPSESPFTEAETRKYFKEILCGVEHLHQQKIVHRDLKPDNMLLSKDGVVKISDFGFCDEVGSDSEEGDTESDSNAEPEVSAVHGTPAFTPPECLLPRKKQVSGLALDMWSLGVTLYALVVGDVPFKGDNMPQLFKSILSDPFEYPPNLVISPLLHDLISNLLTKDPKKRIKMEEVKNHPWLDDDLPQKIPDESVDSTQCERLLVTPAALHHLRT